MKNLKPQSQFEGHRFTERKVKSARKNLEQKLGGILKTPEGCLKVIEKVLRPGMEYPNPVLIAVERILYSLLNKARYSTNREAYIERYIMLIKRAVELSRREPENFPGEYDERELIGEKSPRRKEYLLPKRGEWRGIKFD